MPWDDFGDSWRHEVLFEGQSEPIEGQDYPRCIEGAGACPPEDVGGVVGYAEFLAALADPDHAEHKNLQAWSGGGFSPDAFDPAAATERMRQGLPDWD